MESATRVLPLFPLNVVLFPYMRLPLHIFEDRYKQMIGRCLEDDRTFGVVLIRSGPEVGGPAEPHEVGTVAHIDRMEPLADGRMGLATRGQQRFRILEVIEERPYVVGRVELLEEQTEPPASAEVLDTVRSLTQICLRKNLALNDGWSRQIPMPADPTTLSFFIGIRLEVGRGAKQRLLAAPTVAERLRLEEPLLDQEVARLDRAIANRMWMRNERWN